MEDRLNPAPALIQSFDTITAEENLNLNLFFSAPSDATGAVGPSHVVVATNTSIGWYTKTGVTQAEIPLTSGNPTPEFWPSLNPDPFDVFDPKVIYDPYAQRFVMVALESDQFTTSRLLMAVSQTSDPNAGWFFQSVDVMVNIGGEDHWFDFPGLAVDENAIYITGNMFGTFTGGFGGPRLVILNKGLYSGDNGSTARIFDPFRGSGLFSGTLQPSGLDGVRPAGTTGAYLIGYVSNVDFFGNDEARVVRIDNPLSVSPTFTINRVNMGNVDSSPLFLPDPPQLGSAQPLESNDNRLLSAVWRNNTLTFVNSVNPPVGVDKGQATVHWTQVSTAGPTPVLLNQGNIGGEEIGPGTATIFPSVAVDKYGRLGIGYVAGSKDIFPSSYFTVVDRPQDGSMSAPILTKAGTAATTDARWGDYSAVGLDPTGLTFWQFNQYSAPAPSITPPDGWVNFAAEIDPGSIGRFAVGADAGGGPNVQVYGFTGTFEFSFNAYPASFTGGVRVAVADVNGDQVADIITAPGRGGGPNVRVFSGKDLQELYSFHAYASSFTAGLYVAAGDMDGDGIPELVTSADAGGGPNVRVFKLGANREVTLAHSFYAYSSVFTGGVRVAVGDYNNDFAADIVTSPGFGGGPHIMVFDGLAAMSGRTVTLKSFMAGDPRSTYGAYVAIGNMNGDGVNDFVVGSGSGFREVRVYDGRTLAFLSGFTVDQPGQPTARPLGDSAPVGGLLGGVGTPDQLPTDQTQVNPDTTPTAPFAGLRVAVTDLNFDGNDDILAIGGPQDQSILRLRNGLSMTALRPDRFIFDRGFRGGAFVAASR